jgi:RNA methyltransferase, TrmH family
MISKNKTKYIISLQKKKEREKERMYVIEGDKLIKEFLIAEVPVKMLFAKPEFIRSLTADMRKHAEEIEDASYEELKAISTLKTPHNAVAIVPMTRSEMNTESVLSRLCVALDFVQDPGNLGTIIRAAAWFGIRNIICSSECVDVYNPKVIQASMGAILHVSVHYADLKKLLIEANESNIPVFGTMLEGESIYLHSLNNKGIILLGNESRGISGELIPYISDRIMIPRFTTSTAGIESLNVSMAASVIFSEFLRRTYR